MCQFFSFVTDPVGHPAEYYFFDWVYRKANLDDEGVDSHSHICAHFRLDEDRCNKYEYNPLTGEFVVDQINSKRNDSEAAEKWARRLDFKYVVEPLIVKPIVNPFELPKVEQVTDEQIGWLKDWSSVGASVWNSVRASVGNSVWATVGNSVRATVGNSVRAYVGNSVRASVGNSVGASVWDTVWDTVWATVGNSVWATVGNSVRATVGNSVRACVGNSVRASVGNSVRALVWAYISSFFKIDYKYDFAPAVKLWESGLVPSFHGDVWRLHSGTKADVVYEWMPDKEREDSE